MRIISGLYKNRRIHFQNLKIRPTTDFAKESLFNLLNNHFDLTKTKVLDLFAGSGNISYEFVSRGAESTAVDNSIKCVHFMKQIKSGLSIENLNIIYGNVTSFLKKNTLKYDVIFADPPYNYTQKKYGDLIDLIFTKKILSKNGILIMEHSKFINFEEHPLFYMHKKYGNVHFTFLNNES